MTIAKLSSRAIFIFAAVGMFLWLTTTPIFACDIIFSPAKTGGEVGEIIEVGLSVHLTHRNCPVPMEDTKYITSDNLAIVGQTDWVSGGRDEYTSVLSIQFLAPGTAELEVVRECLKEGGHASIKFSVGGEGVIESSTNVAPSDGLSDTDTLSPIFQTGDGDESEMTWMEAFQRAFSQPFILAYLSLTAFAYVALLLRRRRWRFVSLAFAMVYLGFFLGLCPCVIGAMQNVVLHLGDIKEYLAHFIILAIPVFSTFFLGRLYCGWVCPMGAVQQFLYRRDLSVKLPEGLGAKLRPMRFAVLAAIIIAALYSGTAAFAEIDPFKSLFNAQISPVPTTLLVLLLVSSIFIFTPWCRFLCPMGAVLSIVARFARRQVSFKTECRNCGACAKSFCDYKAIKPGAVMPMIEQHECVRCGECIARCPKKAMDYMLPVIEGQAIDQGLRPPQHLPEIIQVPEKVDAL